jgi:hypothetical protein
MYSFLAQIIDRNQVGLPKVDANQGTFSKIFTLIFIFIGALAFLMLVIAGFRYVISEGDPSKVAEIKMQILYGVAGLVLAASAVAVVNFVLGRF